MSILPKPRSLKSPSWRLDACLSAEDGLGIEDCSYTTRLYSYLNLEAEDSCPIIEEAYLLYYLPQSRAILSSLLLANCDAVSIAGYIQTSEEVVDAYGKLFFDTSVFPNKLVMKDYVDTLPEHTAYNKHSKALMRAALSLGSRYVAWKMSLSLDTELESNEVTKQLLEDSYWRAREHKPFSIDDPRAKESRSWTPQVLRTLDAINGSRIESELSVESLKLKLVKTDSTLPRAALSEDIKG